MQETEKEQREAPHPPGQRDLVSEVLVSVAVSQADAQDDDPEEIFLKAVAEIDTQPLPPPQEVPWPMVFLTLLLLLSFTGGSIIGLLTYPTVTVTVVPVTKHVSLTAPLSLPTRALAPVTLTKSLTSDTTGTGHQRARSASGMLTFYNGQATAQTIPGGTVFTGQDGVKVAADQSVTIPAGTPPTYGQTSMAAHALVPGSVGNIAAGDIDTSIVLAVFVKNGAFSGGQNQRNYRAVAQRDRDTIAVQLRSTLMQELPQEFPLAVDEQVFLANCAFKVSSDHQVGAEASTLSVTATETCAGITYDPGQLHQQATKLFTQHTAPGTQYQLFGEVQVQIVSATPLTVSCRGLWAYSLSQDYEQFLAERIAGDSPQQAQKYLLRTGFITQVTVTQSLPKDSEHIRFLLLVGV